MAKVINIASSDELKTFLKKALEENLIDGVLGLYWMPSMDMLTLALSSNPYEIDNLEVVAPVIPVQAARVISNIKFTESSLRVACIVKPCELRASVELIKLKQIMPEKLIFISYDCGGAINVEDFKNDVNNGKNPVTVLADNNRAFKDFAMSEEKSRFACKVCDKFLPLLCDIRIRSFGEKMCLEAVSERGTELCNALQLKTEETELNQYDEKIKAIFEKRKEMRDRERNLFKNTINSIDSITKELSACIRCHNCMTNCPLDYCKECIFKTPVFDHPAENYELWLNRKKTVKLPTDTLLFHLTRLNHMSSSCVSCGCCESACPVGIKLSRMFMFIGESVQKIFDYEPGRSLQEELPVATFREKELGNV